MTTQAEHRFPIRQLMPALAAALRGADADIAGGLPWRVKQVQRQDWPTTLAQDPLIKRGYTPRQSLRLLAALSLLDAGLGPTQAVAAASDNENGLLAAMAGAFTPSGAGPERLLALFRPRTIDGAGGADDEAGPVVVETLPAGEILERLQIAEPGPAWLVVDLASQCRAMVGTLDPGAAAVAAFAAAAQDGVRETLRGRGHVPARHPRGDRYLTRRAAARKD